MCLVYNMGKLLIFKGLNVELRMELECVVLLILVGKVDEEGVVRFLVLTIFLEDFIWVCTICGACVYECFVDIEYIDIIVELCCYKVMMEGELFDGGAGLFKNLERWGNFWGVRDSCIVWVEGLDVLVWGKDGEDFDILYWVGCVGFFDPEVQKTSIVVVKVLWVA